MSYENKDRYIKNARDDVINMRGELRNVSIHSDSPKTVTSTRSAITSSGGKRLIRITNVGTNDCYIGDITVTSSNGEIIYAEGATVTFDNVKDDFTVYVVTGGSDETELRIIEA